ncbi:MAG TPA: NF038129 family PEP-CTERM protein, partial [Pirellulales bacterium]|nr:NF038129 family PEP-CTERM protein [Pirellulales bacterium]
TLSGTITPQFVLGDSFTGGLAFDDHSHVANGPTNLYAIGGSGAAAFYEIPFGTGITAAAALPLFEAGANFNDGVIVTASHAFSAEGAVNVNVAIADLGGAPQITAESTATVVDPSPLPQPAPGAFNAMQQVTTGPLDLASFLVPGGVETGPNQYTAQIAWGDGTSTSGTLTLAADTITVVGSHTYTATGPMHPAVTLTDDTGNSATSSGNLFVDTDVSGRVKAVAAGLVFNPSTRLFVGHVTITNTSPSDIAGPLPVVFKDLPVGVTPPQFTARTGSGDPYFIDPIAKLAAGQSSTFEVDFSDPTFAAISYSLAVFDPPAAGAAATAPQGEIDVASHPPGMATYHLSVDTSALEGSQGLVALQFNPGGLPGAQTGTAAVDHFVITGGSLSGAASEQGGASGSLNSAVQIANSGVINEFSEAVTFGTTISFDLTLSGDAVERPNNGLFGSAFAIQLLAADGITPRLTSDATGAVLIAYVNPDGSSVVKGVAPIGYTLGQTASGALAAAGDLAAYAFHGAAGQKIYYDALENDSAAIDATLISPSGHKLFFANDNIDQGPLTLPEDGVYTLAITGEGAAAGGFSFRILDVSQQPAVAMGATQTGALTPGLSSDIYRIPGTAGQRLLLTNLSTLGSQDGVSRWTLYTPDEHQLASAYLSFQYDGYNNILALLPATGTYTLVVSGGNSTGPVRYGFIANTPPAQPTDITLGQTVTGNFTSPGQVDTYTLAAVAGQKLMFDEINFYDSNGGITLTTPGGSVLASGTPGFFPDQPFTLAETGTYRLQSAPRSSGPYSFRFLNVADQPAITLGATLTGALTPPFHDSVYTYTGTAGERLHFQGVGTYTRNSAPSWTLYDAHDGFGYQTIVNDPVDVAGDFFQNRDITLPDTGTYTVIVGNNYSFSGTFSFKVTDGFMTTQPLVFGTAITGNPAGGQQDQYTFTGTAGHVLFLDSSDSVLPSDTVHPAYATLAAPNGNLAAVEFYNRALNDLSGQDQVRLPVSGAYTLTVRAPSVPTPYHFRLVDVTAQTPITFGQVYSGTITTSAVSDVYRISGTAGQRLFFDDLTTPTADGNGTTSNWLLFGPDGSRIDVVSLTPISARFGNTLSNFQAILPFAGDYTLLVSRGRYIFADDVSYRFAVYDSPTKTTPLLLGGTVSGNLASPGQQDVYTFRGTPGQRVYIESNSSLQSSGGFSAMLTSPGGKPATPGNNSGGLQTLTEAGTYTFTISAPPGVDATGDYSVRISDVSVAPAVGFGAPVTGTASPGLSNFYLINGAAGQTITFQSLTTPTFQYTLATLYGPAPNQVLASAYITAPPASTFTTMLPASGAYLLAVGEYASGAAVDDYSFQIIDGGTTPPAPPPASTPLVLGQMVSGNIATAGQHDLYTFAGTVGQQLYYSALNAYNSSFVGAALTSPSGAKVFTTDAFTDSGLVTLTETGTYTLQLGLPGQTDIGAYSFRVRDAAAAPAVALGAVIDATLDPSTSTNLYRVSGTAGERLFFQSLPIAINPITRLPIFPVGNWSLYNSADNVLRTAPLDFPNTNNFEIVLPADGTYVLVVNNGAGKAPIEYKLSVTAPPTNSFTLTLGATVNGNIAVADQRDVYTFTGTPDQTLFFNNLSLRAGIGMSLTAPDGQNITKGEGFINFSLPYNLIHLLESGTYTLTVSGDPVQRNSPATAAYSFRLLDAAEATPVALEQTVSVTPSPDLAATFYSIVGTAGERLFFNDLSPVNVSLGEWQFNGTPEYITSPQSGFGTAPLYTPQGSFEVVLPVDGTYTLLVAPDGPYSFKVSSAATNISPVNFGDSVGGATTVPNESDQFTFNAVAGQKLYYDAIGTDPATLFATYTSPLGVVVQLDPPYELKYYHRHPVSADHGPITLTETG